MAEVWFSPADVQEMLRRGKKSNGQSKIAGQMRPCVAIVRREGLSQSHSLFF